MTLAACHLTQEELDELLMGVATPELRAHCAICARCGDRVGALSESIAFYNQASLAWSEARSNTFTRDLSGHKPTRRLTASAARSVAATLILGLVVSLSAGTHLWPAHVASPSLQAAPDVRAQQIARDNAMLDAIDAELTQPESAPATMSHGTADTAAQRSSAQDRD